MDVKELLSVAHVFGGALLRQHQEAYDPCTLLHIEAWT